MNENIDMNKRSDFVDKNGRQIKHRDVINHKFRTYGFVIYADFGIFKDHSSFIVEDQYGKDISESSLRYTLMTSDEFKKSYLETFPNSDVSKFEIGKHGRVASWGSYGLSYLDIEVIGTIPDNNDMRTFKICQL